MHKYIATGLQSSSFRGHKRHFFAEIVAQQTAFSRTFLYNLDHNCVIVFIYLIYYQEFNVFKSLYTKSGLVVEYSHLIIDFLVCNFAAYTGHFCLQSDKINEANTKIFSFGSSSTIQECTYSTERDRYFILSTDLQVQTLSRNTTIYFPIVNFQ